MTTRALLLVLVHLLPAATVGSQGQGSTEAAAAATAPSRPVLQSGPWRAWLDTAGGELPFELDFRVEDGKLRATIINGPERIEVPLVEWEGAELVLDMTQYDAGVRGKLASDGRRLDGSWWRRVGSKDVAALPFHAVAGESSRFAPLPGDAKPSLDLAGRWTVQFDDMESPSLGVFEVDPDGHARGVFLNPTGDYGQLAGRAAAGRLRLSRYNGAYAFLFDASLQPDGTLRGSFWEGNYRAPDVIAWRSDGAETPDGFDQFTWTGKVDLAQIALVDLDGKPRTLADPSFAGRALIVDLLGTWCPNCYDATRYLGELHERHAQRGLSVVGLAFEFGDDFARNVGQVRRYLEVTGSRHPILLVATGEPDSPSVLFPMIQGSFGFPTILFLRGDGTIHAVHTGFTGPATGKAFEELRARMEKVVEELLAEPPGR